MSNTFRGSTNSGNLLFTFFIYIYIFFSFRLSDAVLSMYITAYSIFHSFQVTLSRAMGALSIWQKMKLAWHLITTKDPIRYLHTLSALVLLYWAVCYTCVPLCLKWNSKEYKEYCLVQLLVKVKAISRDSSLKPVNLLQSRRRGKV